MLRRQFFSNNHNNKYFSVMSKESRTKYEMKSIDVSPFDNSGDGLLNYNFVSHAFDSW
jgi:hypothetical protein